MLTLEDLIKAKVLGGGQEKELPCVNGGGYFVTPTVITDTKPNMKVVREEIFGPVLVVESFDDSDLLAPKPFVSVEPTGPSVYRTVDREHPTLIIDEADDLFYRKSDLRAIVNAG